RPRVGDALEQRRIGGKDVVRCDDGRTSFLAGLTEAVESHARRRGFTGASEPAGCPGHPGVDPRFGRRYRGACIINHSSRSMCASKLVTGGYASRSTATSMT